MSQKCKFQILHIYSYGCAASSSFCRCHLHKEENLCQELFLQFLSQSCPLERLRYPRCNLFIFVYKRACWSLVGRTRSVKGAVSVLTGQADTSVGCCTSVVCFMGSPTAPLFCSALLYQDFSTCTRTCTSQCKLQAEWQHLTANRSKHKLWQKSSSTQCRRKDQW